MQQRCAWCIAAVASGLECPPHGPCGQDLCGHDGETCNDGTSHSVVPLLLALGEAVERGCFSAASIKNKPAQSKGETGAFRSHRVILFQKLVWERGSQIAHCIKPNHLDLLKD